ncbi:hypothetical protein [Nocardioides alkalitolerans]|uniref:hypothetical protein n=1 Tax=Nocardioides alkalitolerans TaxID=281714 RepID=UPI000410356F|nr:hypothetical protein [Nocardioides alkalitolerans]
MNRSTTASTLGWSTLVLAGATVVLVMTALLPSAAITAALAVACLTGWDHLRRERRTTSV